MGMRYGKIPGLLQQVPQIFYGTASRSFLFGENCDEVLDAALAHGICAFDTARNYMGAEISLGQWIAARKNRDKIVILTKCGHPSVFGKQRVTEADIRKDFERSVRDLQTDYIDIFLLHRDDLSVPVGEIVELFNEMKKEGKILAFGGSNWTHERIAEANAYAAAHNLTPFSVSSPNFSLADQLGDPWGGGCVSISGPKQKAAREWYQKSNMPIIAYSGLAHGFFSGRVKSSEPEKARQILDEAGRKGYVYPENFERLRRCEKLSEEKNVSVPQLAIAWLLKQGENVFPIVSASSPKRVEENLKALELTMTDREQQYLNLEVDEL